MKFIKAYDESLNCGKTYDKSIKLKQGDTEFIAYDFIQESKGDSDIYETMAKYNMAPSFENVNQFMRNKQKIEGMYEDVRELQNATKSPANIWTTANRARELYDKLPAQIKEIFGNDEKKFMTEGENWLKNALQTQKKQTQEKPEQEDNK